MTKAVLAGAVFVVSGCAMASSEQSALQEQPASPGRLAFAEPPAHYGDDVVLDLYWEACEDVGGIACDTLWRLAPFGSAYEAFAADCGGRGPAIACPQSGETGDVRATGTE